jgi:hypothetical protein
VSAPLVGLILILIGIFCGAIAKGCQTYLDERGDDVTAWAYIPVVGLSLIGIASFLGALIVMVAHIVAHLVRTMP